MSALRPIADFVRGCGRADDHRRRRRRARNNLVIQCDLRKGLCGIKGGYWQRQDVPIETTPRPRPKRADANKSAALMVNRYGLLPIPTTTFPAAASTLLISCSWHNSSTASNLHCSNCRLSRASQIYPAILLRLKA